MLLLVALTFVAVCRSIILSDLSSRQLQYDFVVIGGGTSGSVLASRLSEKADFSVLLLEAGVSNEGVVVSQAPYLVNTMLTEPVYSWNFTTVPQPGLNNRAIPYPRGHILGGCSSHNGMFYTRGSAEDFDRYAALTADNAWSWNSSLKYFFKNEKWTEPIDGHNTQGQFNPADHSTTGRTSVSLAGYEWPVASRVLQTTKELPDEFPFNLDMNSGHPLGVGWLQFTIGKGQRSSAATAYLSPDVLKRPNLHVLLDAKVSRLIPVDLKPAVVAFNEVEFSHGGSSFTVTANKEIVLAGGTVGSAHILLNSGIGNKTVLSSLGITPILDLPSVGQNVSDHAAVIPTWLVNATEPEPATPDSLGQTTTLFDEAFAQWNESRMGPFGVIGVTHVGYFRLDEDALSGIVDPAAGSRTPHFELKFTASHFFRVSGRHYFAINTGVVSPKSRGSITLNASNPTGPPLIDPGLLSDPFDVMVLRHGIKAARRFVSAPSWRSYILADLFSNITSDAELDTFIRNTASSSSHLVGSAAISARDASWGVVDPDLVLKGAKGVRIVDASVLPIVPSAHTQAATYVVAERAADLIKETWM
ncbi:pyranose dehydrogenase [Mycena amicta]|nr:pyranose dehydrogenase [Mycena amicta]